MAQLCSFNSKSRHSNETGLLHTLVRIEMEKPTTEGRYAIGVIDSVQRENVIEREMEKPTTEGKHLISKYTKATLIARSMITNDLLRL